MSAVVTRSANRMYSMFAVAVFALLAVSAAQAISLTATLSGGREVPPNASINTGTTVVNVDPGTGVLSWVTNSTIPLSSVTGHHIHQAGSGVNGPVVVNFSGAYSGSVTISTALAAQIAFNPSSFYVNLHTATFLAGEIRGQLVADPVITPTLSTVSLLALAFALAGFAAFLFRRNRRV
jgi:CHRD domain